MRRLIPSLLSIIASLAILPDTVTACTTFCLKNKNEVLFGKNYDWNIGHGLVFVNRRGVHKVSTDETSPGKWVSKYGSVTFNQYGWESPSGGMNEAGLVIELMWLEGSQYPKDDRPVVDVLEWIQFQLDTSATTAEVIKNSESVRIGSQVPLHYLVNDRTGNSATIEFLNGKLVAHTGEKLPVATLTNDTYARSLDYAARKDVAAARSAGSLDRFARASASTKEFSSKELGQKESVEYAFAILADAAQRGSTQWSIVYDQKRHKIYFKTQDNRQVRIIDARAFDYACGSPVMTFDMNTSDHGDVNHLFSKYARSTNRGLIELSYGGTEFLKNVSPQVKDRYTDFPERFTCSGVVEPKTKAPERAGFSWFDIAFPILSVYKQFAALGY